VRPQKTRSHVTYGRSRGGISAPCVGQFSELLSNVPEVFCKSSGFRCDFVRIPAQELTTFSRNCTVSHQPRKGLFGVEFPEVCTELHTIFRMLTVFAQHENQQFGEAFSGLRPQNGPKTEQVTELSHDTVNSCFSVPRKRM
jgi:hypothetical protein